MGINGLNQFLKTKCPSVFKQKRISEYSGKSIAIDGNNWAYVNMYFAKMRYTSSLTYETINNVDQSQVIKYWVENCINFVVIWLSHSITPIFVFDGEYPIEKKDEQQDRRDRRDKIKKIIEERLLQLSSNPPNKDSLVEEIKKLYNQDFSVSRSDIEYLGSVIKGIGVPFKIAPFEAEKYCSDLSIQSKVDMVFTSDSDALCYGARVIINRYDKVGNDFILTEIKLDDVLEQLQLSLPQFVDLCIMAGCDYNTNIKNVGIGRSYPLIKSKGSIDNIGEKYNIECLKHIICRSLFEHKDVECEDIKIDTDHFVKNARTVLRGANLEYQMNKLVQYLVPERGDLIEF